MLKRTIIFIIAALFIFNTGVAKENDKLLKISATVKPYKIKQGKDGILRIVIKPKFGIKIASHPELRIKLGENNNVSFSKFFFNSSELGFKTIKNNGSVFLKIDEKVIPISFKLKNDALLGTRRIDGEIIFTAVFKDNWSIKTFQKFTAYFISLKNNKIRNY